MTNSPEYPVSTQDDVVQQVSSEAGQEPHDSEERQALTSENSPESTPTMKSKLLFALVNVWLVFHLAASILSPASVNPDSQFTRSGFNLVLPYLELTHLAHGWSFFSPEPGSSTLLEYEVVLTDGTRQTHRVPNFDIKPRLLYHRHFMLTEFLGRLQNAPSEDQELWYRSFARAVCQKHHARSVEIRRVTHRLPNIVRVQAGATLDAPESYDVIFLRAYNREDLL